MWGIITFRDGLVASEHLYWDQASVLVQAGLLAPQGLPVAGVESARAARELSRLAAR
jgi:carboxymethylenebutenolidase